MFCLTRNGGDTYYIDLEPNRTGPDVEYAFTEHFDLVSQLHPLRELDAALPDSQVRGTFCFVVEGKVSRHGNGTRITVWPSRGSRVTGPLPRKRRTATAHGDAEAAEDEDKEEEEEHIMEDIMGSINEDAVSESSAVADTAAESASDDGSTSDSEQDLATLKAELLAAPEGPSELVAAAGKTHLKRTPLWDNRYFFIADNTGHPDVKMNMHKYWSYDPPGGMGLVGRSKTLTPAHYGESREDPVRSFLMLRAWMLWRVKQDGWVDWDRGRQRHFAEEAIVLERKIAALEPRPNGKLLGNAKADALLKGWVPDICARLLQT